MATLLQIDSSPLESSVSRELTREFTKTWLASHPGGRVIYRDLAANPLKPLDAAWIGASFTLESERTPEQREALAISDDLIADVQAADELVIGVAMHNFGIPSVLKLWIDQVVRKGRTFAYGNGGPVGLLSGKKATILSATGGFYEPGTPGGVYNFVDPYLKTVLGFIGIQDVRFITASGVSRMMSGVETRETFLKPTLELVRSMGAAQ